MNTAPLFLVVDDDPSMLELISTQLDLAGFATLRARDGSEGLCKLRNHATDAMILDLNMPRLSGLDVFERMTALGHLPRVPTMMLTASHQASDVQQAIRQVARDYLTKPFEDHVLLTRVTRLLRNDVTRVKPAMAGLVSPTPSRQVW